MKNYVILLLLSLITWSCSPKTREETSVASNQYTADWSSLRKHNTPEWLDGMKFGIYFHWGPQTIEPLYANEKITRLEAIEHWKGENFDAKSWVDLIEAAGAQFGGPVAWHGSGLLNWDSELTDWNSVNKGPKVDIYGSLATELRKRGMPVISSFHTGNFWSRMWGPISWEDSTYLNPHQDNSRYATMNDGRIANVIFDGWYDRITEAIDKYKPDMVWFDVGFGGTLGKELRKEIHKGRLLPEKDNDMNGVPESYQQKLISYYFNQGLKWNKDVEVIYKTHDIPPGIGMRDIEDGNLIGLQYDPWMADIDMSRHVDWSPTWFYNPKNPLKDAATLVDMLVDITSKNGRILLNVPPMADGSFSEEVHTELYALGAWLKINGEAIYNTIPWVFFGEGPTEVTSPGHHGQGKLSGTLIPKYTAKDIRFTQKGNFLYAICLDWPGEEIAIRTLGSDGKLYPNTIKRINMLGSDEELNWKHTPDALIVKFPKEKPCNFAYVLKIERK